MKSIHIFLLALIFLCPSSNAADIWDEPYGRFVQVVVEGEIVPGDFDSLKSLLREKGPLVKEVYLYSPGGDAREAMKIGRMLQTLQITTNAPLTDVAEVGGKWRAIPDCPFVKPKKQANCVCYSSCFLIWIAGIDREGEKLGIHRPKFQKEYFASLSAAAARAEYDEMMKDVEAYLNDYRVPQDIKEKMMMTPSHEIYTYSPRTEATGFIPSYYELLSAKCGATPATLEYKYIDLTVKKKRNKITNDERIELADLKEKLDPIRVCRSYEYLVMRADAFTNYLGIDYHSRMRDEAAK